MTMNERIQSSRLPFHTFQQTGQKMLMHRQIDFDPLKFLQTMQTICSARISPISSFDARLLTNESLAPDIS